jgi:hypothetical protein
MSKQCKITLGNPIAHLKHSPKNLEVKAVSDAAEDKFKRASVDASIRRKPGSAKGDVLYIAEDFDTPLINFAD